MQVEPTPDPDEKYFPHDHAWIIYHNYEATLGSNNNNILTIIGKITTDEIDHPADAPIGRSSYRYTGEDHPIPVELNFRAVRTITWIQWLRIAIDVLNNLPRNEAGEEIECQFVVTGQIRERILGMGSVSLLSSRFFDSDR